MSHSTYRLLLLTVFLQYTCGLYGPNVCLEQQNYTMTTRVKYQQPVSIKTYRWCLGIPPRCSIEHIEMREKWKVQTVVRTKTSDMCCKGFEEDEERCVPKCPAGFTGNLCDQECPLDKWGPSCTEECECPPNSICNVKNGSCVCLEGWFGAQCNIPLFPATRMPFLRVDKEVLKNTHLFDWSPPTMADVQSTERHVTYKNFFLTNEPKFTPTTTSAIERSSTNIVYNYTSTIKPNVIKSTDRSIVLTDKPNASIANGITTTTVVKSTTILTNTTVKLSRSSTTESIPIVTKERQSNDTEISKSTEKIPVTKNIISTTEGSITKRPEIDEIEKTIVVANVTFEDVSKIPTVQSITPKEENVNKTVNNMNINVSTTTVKEIKIENITENESDQKITVKTSNTLKSQIENPTLVTLTITTTSPVVKTTEASKIKDLNETTTTKVYSTSTTKRKPIKHHKSESDILNITLHTFSSRNETGSRIFKTITIAPEINTTAKVPHQKGKIVYESKMITIPVRVIIDSEKSPSNIYLRKMVNGSSRTESINKINKFVTSSPMFTLDIQTEETKHVLTEPEQITSIAGSEDDFDRKEDILSILTITIGVTLLLILTALIIVLVTRYKQIKAEKLKEMELNHVQAMMNVSDDDVQSGYLRSVFHSPLPDPPSQIIAITKPAFSVPLLQSTLTRPVTPALLESFRDILECHYDHPKPPRPTSTPIIQIQSTYQVPPSIYQHLNTFRASSGDANHSKVRMGDVALPVTDAAINVLKLEHQTSQTLGMENREPVYDEIPPWVSETPRNLNKLMYSNEEDITEL